MPSGLPMDSVLHRRLMAVRCIWCTHVSSCCHTHTTTNSGPSLYPLDPPRFATRQPTQRVSKQCSQARPSPTSPKSTSSPAPPNRTPATPVQCSAAPRHQHLRRQQCHLSSEQVKEAHELYKRLWALQNTDRQRRKFRDGWTASFRNSHPVIFMRHVRTLQKLHSKACRCMHRKHLPCESVRGCIRQHGSPWEEGVDGGWEKMHSWGWG
jgi:hypothetical protein